MLIYSLIFGVLAWVLAIAAIRMNKKSSLIIGSFLCCFVSAVWQFFDIRLRADGGDFGGIIDTIDITVIGIVIMMSITLILNSIALKLQDKHK